MAEITKAKLAAVRDALDAALAKIAEQHGLASFRSASCVYEPTGAFTFKIHGVAAGGLTKEQRRYDEGQWLGLPERGSEFSANGKTHRTWGLNSTGSKVITECSDGQKYNWPLAAIKAKFPPPPENDADDNCTGSGP